jgi:hypothetical protein
MNKPGQRMNQFDVETAFPVSVGLLVAGACWAAFWFLAQSPTNLAWQFPIIN